MPIYGFPHYSFRWNAERQEYDILENSQPVGATATTDITAVAICQALNVTRARLSNMKPLIIPQTYAAYIN